MPKVTIEVPEGFEEVVKELEQTLQRAQKGVEGAQAGDLAALDAAWQSVNAGVEESERQMKRRLLRVLDVDAPRVLIDGEPHARVGRYTATYKTRQGPVEVERSLYRQVGVRNGPTVDTVSLSAGCVADGWLPEAARAMAHLLARGTSREAESTARALGVLPYSRSSFERVGHAVGALYGSQRPRVEAALAEAARGTRGHAQRERQLGPGGAAHGGAEKRPVGRPRQGAPKRPVDVVWRMAYVGLPHPPRREGRGPASLRYGRMPQGDAKAVPSAWRKTSRRCSARQPCPAVGAHRRRSGDARLLDEALAAHAPTANARGAPGGLLAPDGEARAGALLMPRSDMAPPCVRSGSCRCSTKPGAVWQRRHRAARQSASATASSATAGPSTRPSPTWRTTANGCTTPMAR